MKHIHTYTHIYVYMKFKFRAHCANKVCCIVQRPLDMPRYFATTLNLTYLYIFNLIFHKVNV